MDLIEEISSLKWGLSKEEYRNVFLNKQWQPDHPTQNAVGFHDTIQDRTVFVVAYFLTDEQDKLAKITITFEGIETDTQRKYIFENQIKYLTEKYGKPIHSITMPKESVAMPECCFSKSIMWKTNDTMINISLALSEHGSPNPFFGITFFDKQKDPFMKEFANWIEDDLKDSDNQTEENQKISVKTASEVIGNCLSIGAYKDTEVILKEISKELINIDETTFGHICVEMLHFYLNLTDRFAFQYLESNQRSVLFSDVVDIVLKNHLEDYYKSIKDNLIDNPIKVKIHPDTFRRIFNETHNKRQTEYGKYKFFKNIEKGLKDDLFFEFECKIAEILGAKNDPCVILPIHGILMPFVGKYHKFCKTIMSEISSDEALPQ